MALLPSFEFAEPRLPEEGSLVLVVAEGGALGPLGHEIEQRTDGLIAAASKIRKFTGKKLKSLTLVAPRGTSLDRLVLVGLGKPAELEESDWVKLGGVTAAALDGAEKATVVLERTGEDAVTPRQAADVALGLLLRSYRFERYKTKKNDGENDTEAPRSLTIGVEGGSGAAALWAGGKHVADGVCLARDLVNEPANVLGPVEFAERAASLAELGVKVDVLDEAKLEALGMRALLGVALGSARPPRLVVMRWDGGAEGSAPVAVVGKGVVFDTGGISIKPAQNMEDMKGDMAGAATVVGLMHALAARKARCNVVGVIGLVENMPDGKAQRPGDIVTSMSGQTIEVINTDAEGRLVLADALTHTIREFKPRLVVDLATLTGAVIVALGHFHAGLYTNEEELAARLTAAGKATGDRVWPMPLGKDYDKLIDSKVADMKNVGGRWGGSITAAQFLRRFVGDTPWVHLDIAGTAMGAPSDEISQTFGSGYGVRLLDRLIAEHYED